MSADRIVRHTTADDAKQEEYKGHAQELQKFELDKSTRNMASPQKFEPIVHAEVLDLDWLERYGGTHPSRFFNGYKYIGCSKPLDCAKTTFQFMQVVLKFGHRIAIFI
jgi:hypothetical protein